MISDVWHRPSSGHVPTVVRVVRTQALMNPAAAFAYASSPVTAQARASPYAAAVSSTNGPSVPSISSGSCGRGATPTMAFAYSRRSATADRYGSSPFAARSARRRSSSIEARSPGVRTPRWTEGWPDERARPATATRMTMMARARSAIASHRRRLVRRRPGGLPPSIGATSSAIGVTVAGVPPSIDRS
jgi:hypothetical protein